MDYLLPLFASGLLITAAHTILLYRYKHSRKWSISEHAVLSHRSLLLYRVSHFITGALFLVFSWNYFMRTVDISGLFWFGVWIVAFEYIQAILPAKGSTNAAHTLSAQIMWGSLIMLGVLCILVLPVDTERKLTAGMLYVLLFGTLAYTLTHMQKLYFNQVTMVILFYSALIVLTA